MNPNNPIPIPPKLLWREFITRFLPVIMFGVVLVAALMLWRNRLTPASIPGEAEGIQAIVNSPDTGILTELNVRSFQVVKAGEALGKIVVNDPKNPQLLVAPIDGAVTYLHAAIGDKVKAGLPVITIGSTKPDRIVAFLRQPIAFEPSTGATVIVRARNSQPGAATVLRVGSQLMPIRTTLLPPMVFTSKHSSHEVDHNELGLPLIVSVPSDLKLYPGEIVDLTILPPTPPPPPAPIAAPTPTNAPTATATNAAATAAKTNAPAAAPAPTAPAAPAKK